MATLTFRILDEPVAFEADRLPDRIRLDEALVPLRALDDKAIDIAIRKNGLPVTCAKGCSQCCQIQPVPVTPTEAYALLLLVESLPEDRRQELRARFADRTARLRQAGLESIFEGRGSFSDGQEGREQASRYLDLKLPCPFLEQDCCSIYENRPLNCREYVVTSPKQFCAEPLTAPIRRVAPPVALDAADLSATSQLLGTRQYRIPLVLALDYAEKHRAEFARTFPAREVLAPLLGAVLIGSQVS